MIFGNNNSNTGRSGNSYFSFGKNGRDNVSVNGNSMTDTKGNRAVKNGNSMRVGSSTVSKNGNSFYTQKGTYTLRGNTLYGPGGKFWTGINSDRDAEAIIFNEIK